MGGFPPRDIKAIPIPDPQKGVGMSARGLYVGCVRNLSLAIEGEADVARTTAVRRT